MEKTIIQINLDSELKKEAGVIFERLGLDVPSAINIFLHQCVLHGGLPFSIKSPQYNRETLEAIDEARRLSKDPCAVGYRGMDELKTALEEK